MAPRAPFFFLNRAGDLDTPFWPTQANRKPPRRSLAVVPVGDASLSTEEGTMSLSVGFGVIEKLGGDFGKK
jgi:hypothetical protein